MTTPTNHLTDEALDDILIGSGDSAANAHLAVCAPCTERLEAFRAPVALFNQASETWSHARSNTISRVLVPRRASLGNVPAWSLVTAVVLAVGFAVDSGVRRDPQPTVAQQTATDLQQEIASDNAMLIAIDSELSRRIPSPTDVYGLEKPTRRSTTAEVHN